MTGEETADEDDKAEADVGYSYNVLARLTLGGPLEEVAKDEAEDDLTAEEEATTEEEITIEDEATTEEGATIEDETTIEDEVADEDDEEEADVGYSYNVLVVCCMHA
ncbi:unnamed protein product [[Candida] boidinii]|nr:unnamed protein product [[Candida] boidinii]